MTHHKTLAAILMLVLLLACPDLSRAVNLNIDATSKYAWSAKTGWINFAPTGGGVVVEADRLSGTAWSETLGWIAFGASGYSGGYANTNASDWGVVREGSTYLSGYAWSAKAGWINFAPTGGGVSIGVDGVFSGRAWGENIGWIDFTDSQSPARYAVAVVKADQTITFDPLVDKTFGDADFTLGATADSGLEVNYVSTTTGVCTVAENWVFLVAPGTCSITASQPGDTNYNAATEVSRSFAVLVDSDGDGLADGSDPCPLDADNDLDGDGICGNLDNCPATANVDQYDSNGNNTGDACETVSLVPLAGAFHLANLLGEHAGEDYNALLMNGVGALTLVEDKSWTLSYDALGFGQPEATSHAATLPLTGTWSNYRDGHLTLGGWHAVHNGARTLLAWVPVPGNAANAETGLGLALRPASGLSDASLSGTYHLVSLVAHHGGANDGTTRFAAGLGSISFDGARGYSGSYTSIATGQAESGPLVPGAFSGGYQLNADGRLLLDAIDNGMVSADTGLLVWSNAPGELADEPTGLHLALKPSSAASVTTLTGRYNLVSYQAQHAGATTGALLSSGYGSLTFDGAGHYVGTIERVADGQGGGGTLTTGIVSGSYAVESDGRILLDDEQSGFVSSDGRIVVYTPIPGPAGGEATGLTLLLGAEPAELFPPVSAVTLTPGISSPALPGATVTFVANASGGSGSYEYKFWVKNPAGVWSVGRDYGPAAAWSWVTTSLPVGTYQIVVHARNVGSSKSYESYNSVSFPLMIPVSGVTLTPVDASPISIGTTIPFTAAASGGNGNYEYKYWVKNSAGTWSVLRHYATTATCNWTTTGLAAGTYTISVHVRNVGSTQSYEAYTSQSYVLTNPASVASLTTGVVSPSNIGTTISLTAAASGGSGNYEYKFWVKNSAGTWSVLRHYATTATYNWTTTGLASGTYTVSVHVRNVGSNANYETYASITHLLVTPASAVILTPGDASPSTLGSVIPFTALASGGSNNYEYKFWVTKPDGVWVLGRDYASTTSWAWTTTGLPSGTYTISVHARNIGSTANYEAYISVPYVLMQPASVVTLTPDLATIIGIGTPVVLNAVASGGSGTYEYKFWLKNPSGVWSVLRDYSSVPTYNWSTYGLNPGTFTIVVHARNAGSVMSYEAYSSVAFVLQ